MNDLVLQPDPWEDLRRFTAARLALGRAGASLPTTELLKLGAAQAEARDAVHTALDLPPLVDAIEAMGLETRQVRSAAPDRASYLLRPDLGRRLADEARAAPSATDPVDLLIVVADGLSATAVQRHAAGLVEQLIASPPAGWTIGPVVIATQARVALGDEIGEAMAAKFVAVLIGERPGLSSPDSLGIYLTADPRRGRRDSERNCISNVRPEGLKLPDAARRLWWLLEAARRMGATGVALKDESGGAARIDNRPDEP